MSETGPGSPSPTIQTVSTNAFPFLFAEQATGDRQAAEALLLTFNTDLGFFEARLLGVLRATGASVTVIGDARMWKPDTRAAQHAGRSYHFGLCGTGAAFHPKLLVVAGARRAIAAVGSGNLTMGGWQYNSELLTVFTGNSERIPAAFTDIRHIIATLSTHASPTHALDPIAIAAIGRTATALDELLGTAEIVETGHRVHASWNGPLIEQLPTEPVAELYLTAPFHDMASEAVRQILHRLQPRHVKVAVQPGWTHLDPNALVAVLARYADKYDATWELLRDPDSYGTADARYRHGKLIEWTTTVGDRHGLTGSPNLSNRALIAEVATGGNHEIAVVGPIVQSLFPGGDPIVVDDIPVVRDLDDSETDGECDEPEHSTPTIYVAAAAFGRDGSGIDIHLNRPAPPAPVTVMVEVSPHRASPDDWILIGDIPAQSRTQTLPSDTVLGGVPAGSRIRAVVTDPTAGTRRSAPVYVADIQRVTTRIGPSRPTSRTQRAAPDDLFGSDTTLLDSLQNDLVAFARDLANAKKPTLTRDGPTEASSPDRGPAVDGAEPWLWLQETTIHRYGQGIASWLLAIPFPDRTNTLGDVDGTAVPWLDRINEDTEVGLENEDTEKATNEVLEDEPEPDPEQTALNHRGDSERLKAMRRKWVTRAAAVAPDVPVVSRLLILRLALAFWSAGNWPETDVEPHTTVRNLLTTLRDAYDQPIELRERVSALAAIALTVMRHRTDLSTGDQRTLTYRAATELARPLITDLTEEVIDAYATGIRTGNGGVLTPGHVLEAIADLTHDDPLMALQPLMEERGYTVTRPARNQIHIHGTFPTPEQVALDAVGIVEDTSGIVVWTSNTRGDWTLVAWDSPDLVTINKRDSIRWRHQRLGLMSPAAVAVALKQGPGNLPDLVTPKGLPKHSPTPEAHGVLAGVGVNDPAPPDLT